MKRFLMLAAVAVVAGAMYVAASPGASQRSSGVSQRQFNALEKKVAALSKTLKTVKAEAADADGFVRTCFLSTNGGVLGINQFGDPAGTFGYKYTADGTTLTDTTALNIDPSTTPGAWLQSVDPTCVAPALRHRQMHSGSGLQLRAEHVR